MVEYATVENEREELMRNAMILFRIIYGVEIAVENSFLKRVDILVDIFFAIYELYVFP